MRERDDLTHAPEKGERVNDLIAGMGRERMDLRARRTMILLLRIASFACLGVAVLSFAGYAPYAPAPIIVFLGTAGFGFGISVLGAPRP